MIQVLFIDAKVKQVYQERIAPSYTDFERLIGTAFWVQCRINGTDRIMVAEWDAGREADFALDGEKWQGNAVIYHEDEFSIPEAPRLTLAEARERVTFLRDPCLKYLLPEM